MNATAIESALAKLHEIADGSEPELSLGLGMGQAAALLAKIEAADRLVEAAESQAADLGHTDTYLLDCAATYRNPQPAAEGEKS